MQYVIKLTSGGLVGCFDVHIDASYRARELFGEKGWQIVPMLTDHPGMEREIASALEVARTQPGNLITQLKFFRKLRPMSLLPAKTLMEMARAIRQSETASH